MPSETALNEAREHLLANGIKIKHDLDHGFCKSIYFDDPGNGINLEFAVYTAKCTEEEPFLQDAAPTPAAAAYLGSRQEDFLLHFTPDGHGGMRVEKGVGAAH